jgi:chromatin remodeling complex protein RSC6
MLDVKKKNERLILTQKRLTPNKKLSLLIGSDTRTKSKIMKDVFNYIKINKLHDSLDRNYIITDKKLKSIVKKNRVSIRSIHVQVFKNTTQEGI